MNVIVDTCVWSRFLRRNRPESDLVAEEVARLVRRDAVQLLGPIRQELLSGAQPDERFEQLRDYLTSNPICLWTKRTMKPPPGIMITFVNEACKVPGRTC